MADGLLDSIGQAIRQQYQTTKQGLGLLVSDPRRYLEERNKQLEAFNQAQMAAMPAERAELRGLLATPEQLAAKQYADQQLQDLALGFAGNIKPVSNLTSIYHGTSPQAAKAIEKSGFDVNKSADGTIWFTSNPNIGEVAASGKGGVVKRMIDKSKMKLGGWEEADKYSTNELMNMGYDGLALKDGDLITYQIFNPEKLKK